MRPTLPLIPVIAATLFASTSLAWLPSLGDGGGGELPTSVQVHSRQDIMLAGDSGGGGGDLPAEVDVSELSSVLYLSQVRGMVADGPWFKHSPDGRPGGGEWHFGTPLVGECSHADRNFFLAGVFLSSGGGGGDLPAPADLTFADQLLVQAPGLGQVFWVGNGRVGDSGSAQQVVVPDGAAKLYLGFVETDPNGNSADFSNNSGRVQVKLLGGGSHHQHR